MPMPTVALPGVHLMFDDVLLLHVVRAEVVRDDVGFHRHAAELLEEADVVAADIEREAACGIRCVVSQPFASILLLIRSFSAGPARRASAATTLPPTPRDSCLARPTLWSPKIPLTFSGSFAFHLAVGSAHPPYCE